jgi:hypothetical protein
MGLIACEAQTMIETALNSHWKLKAVDSRYLKKFKEHVKVVDSLIDNPQIRRILLKIIINLIYLILIVYNGTQYIYIY